MDDSLDSKLKKIRVEYDLAKTSFAAIMEYVDSEVYLEAVESLDLEFPLPSPLETSNVLDYVQVDQPKKTLLDWMALNPLPPHTAKFELAVPLVTAVPFPVKEYGDLGDQMDKLMDFAEQISRTYVESLAREMLGKASELMVDMHACLQAPQQALMTPFQDAPSDAAVSAALACEQAYKYVAEAFPQHVASLVARAGPSSGQHAIASVTPSRDVPATYLFLNGTRQAPLTNRSHAFPPNMIIGRFQLNIQFYSLGVKDNHTGQSVFRAFFPPEECQIHFRELGTRGFSIFMATSSTDDVIRYVKNDAARLSDPVPLAREVRFAVQLETHGLPTVVPYFFEAYGDGAVTLTSRPTAGLLPVNADNNGQPLPFQDSNYQYAELRH